MKYILVTFFIFFYTFSFSQERYTLIYLDDIQRYDREKLKEELMKVINNTENIFKTLSWVYMGRGEIFFYAFSLIYILKKRISIMNRYKL